MLQRHKQTVFSDYFNKTKENGEFNPQEKSSV